MWGMRFVEKAESDKAWRPFSQVKAWEWIFLKAIQGFVIKFVGLA